VYNHVLALATEFLSDHRSSYFLTTQTLSKLRL